MSGDADAVARLRDKLAKAEASQSRMVAGNKAIREFAKMGKEAQVATLVSLGIGEANARARLEPDFAKRIGWVDYELRNNGANIRTLRARLAGLEQAKATPASSADGKHGRVEDVPADNRVRVWFPWKPSAEVRARLKKGGFRWAPTVQVADAPTVGCWQAYRNHGTLALASCEVGAEIPRAVAALAERGITATPAEVAAIVEATPPEARTAVLGTLTTGPTRDMFAGL